MCVAAGYSFYQAYNRLRCTVAFQGYVEPRQSDAEVYFIRSKAEDGRESINEIRLVRFLVPFRCPC